ncbi:hypothetical protein BST20_13615 [Mycobacterium branderi]|uniref:Lipoprotein n=1 Tax=Mycobacterium branderi TaxID=43348 RepID=A0AA91LWZ3_9MYCO|nr:hypothetical protein BST20_13615 [Mycobacterium branderi]
MRLLIAAAVVIATMSGCGFPDRRGAANTIGDAIRAMPGVTSAEVDYHTSFDGGAHFKLYVALADNASDTQAADVGRTFVDRMRAADFAEFHVELAVTYKASSDANTTAPGSSATFTYQFSRTGRGGPSSSQVADSLALWLQVGQSPATTGVLLNQPSWGGPPSSRSITVYLPPSVTDAAIADLIHAHSELARATWQVNSPAANRFGQPRTYAVRGPFPDQRRRELWQQILNQIGPDDGAQATTDTIEVHPEVAPTRVEIDVASGRDEQQRFEHIAHTVTPLLPGLGLPISFRLMAYVDQIEFTLGGCDRPDPRHTSSPLENELRRQFQRC